MAIKNYYTRDQAQECVDEWNSLDDITQAQHILAHTPFYGEYLKSAAAVKHDAEVAQFMSSPQWRAQLRELIKP